MYAYGITSCTTNVRVLYIDIDSLRPDHIGVYGYDTATTPNIDALADDAIRFRRAYVANSPCLPSRAALLTGRYGIANGVETHGPRSQVLNHPATNVSWAGTWSDHVSERPWWSLPRLFYEHRVPTIAVSSFPRHPAPWFHDTWHEIHQTQEPTGATESFQTPRAATVVDDAIDTFERHDGDDLFAYVQFWDPHAPYLRSDDEVREFEPVSMPTHPTQDQLADHRNWDAWRSATHMDISNRNDLGRLLANYDAEVHYVDRHVGRLIDHLKEAGIYQETLIVLTADHGEEFGEHGVYREHWSTYDGTQRVPLLIKPPADTGFKPDVRSELVTNVDIAPTLADYADMRPPACWHGDSVRPVIESQNAPWREYIVLDHGLYTAQRAVRTARWKLLKTYHPGMWGPVLPETLLFNMEADPWEQTDVATEHPAVIKRLEAHLDEWVNEHEAEKGDMLQTITEEGPAGFNAFQDEFDGL